MKATLEISLYPFSNNYKKIIYSFIERIQKNKKILVRTNSMSTQVSGDIDLIMDLLKKEMKSTFKKNKAMFIFKIAKGERIKKVVSKN